MTESAAADAAAEHGSGCIITGASSGIGQAIAIRLSTEYPLVLQGRDLGRLEKTLESCDHRHAHRIWPFDLRQTAAIETELSSYLTDADLRISAFVHAAGMVRALPARTLFLESVIQSLDVNYISATQIVTTLLKKSVNHTALRGLVFVSSIWSQFGAENHSLYCASKGALDAFMRAIAVELAPRGIRANSVAPGAIRTPLSESRFSDPVQRAAMLARYPLGEGYPGDVADAVMFLLSDSARWITGQTLHVDGGWSCH